MLTENGIINFNKQNVYADKSGRGYGFGYFSKKDFRPGDVVIRTFGKIINHQTSHYSLQIDFGRHFIPKKWTGRYLNHSCSPNTFIKTRGDGFPDLIASIKIKRDQEITYAYSMSEYTWSRNTAENYLHCKCGSKKCKGKILSFSQLSKIEKKRLIDKKSCSKYLWRSI